MSQEIEYVIDISDPNDHLLLHVEGQDGLGTLHVRENGRRFDITFQELRDGVMSGKYQLSPKQ